MYAYTQSAEEYKCYSSIFTLFDQDEQAEDRKLPHWHEIYMEFNAYNHDYNDLADIHNFELQTYSASVVHNHHLGTDDIFFKDNASEDAFKVPDYRYRDLIRLNPLGNGYDEWDVDPRELIRDCRVRLTQQTPWILTSDALVTFY